MDKSFYIKCQNIVGKYFERKTNDINVHAFKVIGFDGKYFQTIDYYLSLGSSVKEYEDGLYYDFWTRPNFVEITEEDFKIIEALHESAGKYEYDE